MFSFFLMWNMFYLHYSCVHFFFFKCKKKCLPIFSQISTRCIFQIQKENYFILKFLHGSCIIIQEACALHDVLQITWNDYLFQLNLYYKIKCQGPLWNPSSITAIMLRGIWRLRYIMSSYKWSPIMPRTSWSVKRRFQLFY